MSNSNTWLALVLGLIGAICVSACGDEQPGTTDAVGGANSTGGTASTNISPSNGGSSSTDGAEPRFDGSCVNRDGQCSELFDCPTTWKRDCPISSTTYSEARCTTADLVGKCWRAGNRQNCGINEFAYDVFDDRAESAASGEMSCRYGDGVWTES